MVIRVILSGVGVGIVGVGMYDVVRRCDRLGKVGVVGMDEGIVGVVLAPVVAVHVQKRIEDHDMDMGIGRDMVAASKVMCNRGWHVDLHISGS